MRNSSWIVLVLAACGGGGSNPDAPPVPDAPPAIDAAPDARVDAMTGVCPNDGVGQGNGGFVKPVVVSRAWTETSPGVYTLVGDADWSCAPRRVEAPFAGGDVAGTITDFQTGNAEAANIELFLDSDLASADVTTTSNGTGAYTTTIGNAVDLAFRLTATDFVPTVHMAPTDFDLGMVSNSLAVALPALIGVTWDQGPLVVGAVRDCAGNQVSDVVVTVSRTDECPEHAAGAGTYYFNDQGLPVRRTVEPVATENGLYLVLVAMAEAPFTGQVQVWGFAAGADPTTDPMILLATRQLGAAAASSATMIAVP